MSLQITEYEERHEELVRAFNTRMSEGGSDWEFYDQSRPTWLGADGLQMPRREFFLAVEDDRVVRGAYCLKFQEFLLSGGLVEAASIQGPVSEGVVDPRYGATALHLIRDMQARQPALFAWGVSDRLLGVLSRLKWRAYATPLCLRVIDARRFLKENRFLSSSPKFERASRLLQASHVENLGAFLVQSAAQIAAGGPPKKARAIVERRFGAWADEIWEVAKGSYRFIAVRNRIVMNRLLPENAWPEADILRIESDGATIGWAAARCSTLRNDARFGNLRVGSILDALAVPGWEGSVLKAATQHLEIQKAEVIVANFSSATWVDNFRRCGFLVSQARRTLVISPRLASEVGEDLEATEMHLTPLDGDGPLGL